MRTEIKLAIATAGLVAGVMLGAPAGHASGDAPWCAVINLGMGDVSWDCRYRTVEECVPNVIAGNRGFCNLNPALPQYQPAPSAVRYRKRHHHG